MIIRLVIVDDHPVVRDGLRGMFAGDARCEVVAVEAAARGEAVLSPSVATKLLGQVREPRPAIQLLSQRELEVLGLVARGRTNREAAADLFVSNVQGPARIEAGGYGRHPFGYSRS
jgi:DNA-binding NarL/FixJ family response regulator